MRLRPHPSVVVCSDIDALLDASSAAGFAAAARRLAPLADDKVALVLCSGRTRAELERVYQELGCTHPFVCEQGAAAFVPEGYFSVTLPQAREEIGRAHV